MKNLARAWQGRSEGERRALSAVAGIIAVALVAGLVWLPLERTRARLAADMPKLRASIESLQRDAAEVQRLRAMPAAAPTANAPLVTLATNAGGLPGSRMNVLDARRVRLVGDDVGFGALLEWLRNARATHGMRVESARIEALPAAGRVRAELVLARS